MLILSCSVTQSCPTLRGPMDCSLTGSCQWNFPGRNTGVGCHFLLQGVFPTQGSNPRLQHLLHWQVDYLTLCHLGSPNKASYGERLAVSFPSSILKCLRKNSPILVSFFKMHINRTTVTLQFNEVVSNAVKNDSRLGPSLAKKQTNLWPIQ